MLIIIYTKNKKLGKKAKNKLWNKLRNSLPKESGELQICLFNENIEQMGVYTNSLSAANDGLLNKIRDILSKDDELKIWLSELQCGEGTYTESNEPFDYFLWFDAKKYYRAAMDLRGNHEKPYFMLLSLSVELFLKCIHTRTRWVGAHGQAVLHLEGHSLKELYSELKKRAPNFTLRLEDKYRAAFNRNFIRDLDVNSDVFTNARYPYLKGGVIPKRPSPFFYTKDEILFGCERKCETDVSITALEMTASILDKYISETFNIHDTPPNSN
ncbi:hypothetical protein GNP84_06695 [Aliivibrio fischeri]|uniref:hypothetical protein n=1 Tax=Aliivibrio fischeri TaxID=668 RepID=UPI0012D8DAAB|nr:hypothetical protein [Aliivibrio fischeri]MUK76594.1 hypothetical protein [Aliivibrio fischeri]